MLRLVHSAQPGVPGDSRPEPVYTIVGLKELVLAVIALGFQFLDEIGGVVLSEDLKLQIIAVATLALGFLAARAARQRVTPIEAPRLETGTAVQITEGGAIVGATRIAA